MTIELDSTLAQAEVLFLSFTQLVADIDRRSAEESSSADTNVLRKRTATAGQETRQGPSRSPRPADTKISSAVISEELRELLKAGR